MSNKLAIVVNFLGNDKLSGALRNIIGTGKTGSQVIKGMAREASGLQRELDKVRREINGSSGNITELVSRERALERQIEKTNEDIAKQRRLMAIDRNADRMRARGEQLQRRGTDNMAGGAAMAGPLVLIGMSAMKNEKALALMGQKLELTRGQTDALGLSLQRTATLTRQMPDDIIAAADFLASKGLGAKQLEGMMPVIGRFGTAWAADVTDTAKAAHANYLSLKVPLNQTAQALEMMAVAGNKGGFEVRNMAAEFPALTANLAKLGSKGLPAVADLSAALQVLEAKSGDGAVAANNLDNMMSFVLSSEGIKKFGDRGVDILGELKRAARDGKSPLETIARLTKQVTGGDDMLIGQIFSDKQARDGVTALIQSEKQYLEIRDAALRARGMTDKEFARMSGTASANWNVLMGSAQGLAVTLGTHLLPLVTSGALWIGNMVRSVAAWAQANPTAASTIMTVITSLVGMKIAFGALQFVLGGLFGPLATVYKFWKKLFPAGLLASRAFGILAKGALGFGRAMLVVGRALLLNPIGLLVTALGVGAYLIYTHWGKIKAAFGAGIAYLGQAWAWLKANARSILEFSGPIGQAALLIWDNWATIKRAFGDALAWLGGKIASFIQVGRDIVGGLVAGIKAAPGRVWEALKSIVMTGIAGIKSYLGIKSPSRLFMSLGGFMSEGMAIGIDRGGRKPLGSMSRLAAGVAAAGAMSLSPAHATGAGSGPGRGASTTPVQPAAPITIHVHGAPGQDVHALADIVMRRLESAQGARRRSTFADEE